MEDQISDSRYLRPCWWCESVGRRAAPVERRSRGNWAAPRGSREDPRRSHDGAPYGSRLVASNGGRGAGSGRL